MFTPLPEILCHDWIHQLHIPTRHLSTYSHSMGTRPYRARRNIRLVASIIQ
jgi:hypothetical protein